MNSEQLARRTVGLGPVLRTLTLEGSAPNARPIKGSGVDVSEAVMAIVSFSGPPHVECTVDLYGRILGGEEFTLLNGFKDLEIDERGWQESLRIPALAEIAIVVTKSNVALNKLKITIAPCMG